MESMNGVHGPSQVLSAESLSLLEEGISLIFSRWTALQMAIQNEWGGRDSRQKSFQLASDLLSWFLQSKVQHYIDDLENMLDESMMLSFNTEIEDGSIEEVAEQLMIMHEDCLQGNYVSVEKLRNSDMGAHSVSQSKQVIDENSDESSYEEASDLAVDEQGSNPEPESKDMMTNELKPKLIKSEAEEGWSIVSPRRSSRGKR